MTKQYQYTQADVICDMIHAVDFYDEVITFGDAIGFTIDFAMSSGKLQLVNTSTPGVMVLGADNTALFSFNDYFDFLEEVSALSGTWKNIRQMANTKAGTKKILKQFLNIARRMENWVI
jgi:hypothetical protein